MKRTVMLTLVMLVFVAVSGASAQGLSWPGEFQAWGVPTSSRGTVTLADNRSASGDMVTQGVIAVVNIKDFGKADFDAYCADLVRAGFVLSQDSLQDVLMVYNRSGNGGAIKVTLSFSPELTTVVANNPAAAKKVPEGNTNLVWPSNAGAIPVFSGGTFKESVHMGEGMYAITFVGVSEAALNDYRSALRNANFQKQDEEDTEGYMKVIGGTAYTVGLVRSGSSLQILTFSMAL